MKLVYIGSGEFGVECLNAIAQSSHKLALVVTQPAQPAGRGRKTTATPVAIWAQQRSIKNVEAADVNSPQIIEQIAANRPDCLVVIAYGQKISRHVIAVAPKGAINVHASLLPKYRGAAPINWAIINGEMQTGVSIITVAEKMDAGDILARQAIDIRPDETAGELHDRLCQIAAPLLVKTLDQIEAGTAVYTKQDESKVTLAPKLKKSDGFLDFTQPAQVLERKIRGLWPWPGASALYLSQKTAKQCRVTIARAAVAESGAPSLPTGTFDEHLDVVCGKDALRIIQILPEGGRLMDFADFVNGRATQTGDMLLKIEK